MNFFAGQTKHPTSLIFFNRKNEMGRQNKCCASVFFINRKYAKNRFNRIYD